MAQIYENFGEYSAGSFPTASDPWSVEWNDGGDNTATLLSDSAYDGGLALEVESNGYLPAYAISHDDVGTVADSEIVVLVESYDALNSTRTRPVVRGSGDASDHTGYFARADEGSDMDLMKYDTSGSYTGLDSSSISANVPFWIRLRASGDTIQARVWEEGTTEPSTWDVSATDTDLSSGFTAYCTMSDSGEWAVTDEVGIGTEGDSAPIEPVGGTAPNPPSDLSVSEI